MPPPVPPNVNEGRMMQGKPMVSMASKASTMARLRYFFRRSGSRSAQPRSKAAISPPSDFRRLVSARKKALSSSLASEALASMDFGVSRPMRFMASRNNSLSSAMSMASALAPMSSTPNFSRMPILLRVRAVFSAVWPPMVGSRASGRSFSMILATTSGVMGSM